MLDDELSEALARSLGTALRHAPPLARRTDELRTAVEVLLLACSVLAGRPSPGCSLVGLRYSPPLSPRQRLLLLALVAGRYAWRRLERASLAWPARRVQAAGVRREPSLADAHALPPGPPAA